MGVNTYVSFFLFVLGAVFGSFLNVVIDRTARNESLLFSRSHCDKCKRKILWYDLFPVFSYLLLGGKCRYCKNPIPKRVFTVELLTGIVFASLFLYTDAFTNIFSFLFLIVIFSCLLVILFIDLEQGIIPDAILAIALIATVIFNIIYFPTTILQNAVVASVTFLFFLLLFFATKGRGMGFGDVKCVFFMGFFLGFPRIIIGLYTAFLTGAIFSLILILLKKKKFHKDTIPFGPFLVLGILVAYFFGNSFTHFLGFL